MIVSRLTFKILLLCLGLSISSTSYAEVSVATSIRPLALIAQAIVEDRGKVSSVIGMQDSPHHYSLSPGDRLSLESADILLWVSPEFEVQLADVFDSLSIEKPVVTATAIADISLLRFDTAELDPHVWLSATNGIAIAKELTRQLQAIDTDNYDSYQNALARFEAKVTTTKLLSARELGALENENYVIFHNAYQYFEREFGMASGLVLLRNAEVQPSMRELLAFRRELDGLAAVCILLEPDSNLELVDTALQGRELKKETVDLLGFAIEDGPESYPQLLSSIADSFKTCLSD